MNRTLVITALVLGTLASGVVSASERCDVPMAEWQPRSALHSKLEADGWTVRRIKSDDGCYEVYAVDPQGRRVEATFDPKTFEMVKMEQDD